MEGGWTENNGTIEAGLILTEFDHAIGGTGTMNASVVIIVVPGTTLSLEHPSCIRQAATCVTGVWGTISTTPALILDAGGLDGTGSVEHGLSNVAGDVLPGALLGTLQVCGDYTQGNAGRLAIVVVGPDVTGSGSGPVTDQLQVTGTAFLGGDLYISYFGQYEPQVGDEFTILTAGHVVGSFASVSGSDAFEVIYGSTSVRIRVPGGGPVLSPPHVIALSPPLGRVYNKDMPLTVMAVTFDKNVSIDGGMVSVNGVNTGSGGDFTFGYDSWSRTATLQWPEDLADDTYVVTVSDAVTAGGVALDGEIDKLNPVLPSGDGTPGGDIVCLVYKLVGDVNEDLSVDVIDLLYLVDAFGTVSGDSNYNPACDFNDDGSVDVLDLLDMVYSFGKTIPEE